MQQDLVDPLDPRRPPGPQGPEVLGHFPELIGKPGPGTYRRQVMPPAEHRMGPTQALAEDLDPAGEQPERDVAVRRQLIEGLLPPRPARLLGEPQASTTALTIESTV